LAKKSSPRHVDSDGNHIHNEILRSVPRDECDVIFSNLEFVRLKSLQLLHDAGDSIKSAYFCNSGMVSTLTVFRDGKTVEVGLIGKEGFVGLPLVAGFRSSSVRANVQIEGSAFRMGAEAFSESLARCPKFALRSSRMLWRCKSHRLRRVTAFMKLKNDSPSGCSCAPIEPGIIVCP